MKNNNKGSITVFLSGVMLLIIVFTCTIIESSRFKVAGIQAERAFMTAANSLLSSYDSQLANEYGIFAYEKPSLYHIEKELIYYANQSLETENIISSSLKGLSNQEKPWDIYDYTISNLSFSPIGYLVEEEPYYLEMQILEYMKYRAPLLVIEPFLEKLELVKKSSSTTKYVNKKMEITSQASHIEELYSQLIQHIEGIQVDDNGSAEINNIFVKGLITNPDLTIDDFITGIPDQAIEQKVKANYLDLNHIKNNFENYSESAYKNGNEMLISYKALYLAEQELDGLNGTYSSLELKVFNKQLQLVGLKQAMVFTQDTEALEKQIASMNNEIKALENELDVLKAEIELKEQDLNYYEKTLNMYISGFHYFYNPMQQMMLQLQSIYVSKESNEEGYLKRNQLALEVVEKIENESLDIVGRINKYKKELEADKTAIIDTTYTAINDEMEKLKANLTMDADSFSLTNNLPLIKEVITTNIHTIEALNQNYNNLIAYNDKYLVQLFAMHFDVYDPDEIDMLNQFIKDKKVQTPYNLVDQLKDYTHEDIKLKLNTQVNAILKGLTAYSNGIQFNYGDMLSNEEVSHLDPRDKMETFAGNQKETLWGKVKDNSIHIEELPSYLINNGLISNSTENSTVDFTDESLSYSTDIMTQLSNFNLTGFNLIDLRDQLYINEYIIGNFNCATDHIEGAFPVSLSNYSKEGHALDYEVEYVIIGSDNEQSNLQGCTNQVLGLRFAMNLIHILSDSAKRNTVWSIASAIAGWWTLGIGTYIVAALIMGAWSYAESYLDVQKLLDGEAVAFFKTPNDWVLDFRNIPNFIIDEGVQYANKTVDVLVDQFNDEVKGYIEKIKSRVTGESKAFVEKQLNEILEMGVSLTENAGFMIDTTVEQVINYSFNAILNESYSPPSIDDYIQINYYGGELASELIAKINKPEFIDDLKSYSYEEVIKQKALLMDSVQTKIDMAKKSVASKIGQRVEDTLTQFETSINAYVDTSSHKIKALAKEEINKLSNSLKEELEDKISAALEETIGDAGKEKVISLSPKFTYKDYLRILLLINNRENKLYRIMDLLQLNIGAFRNDSSARLSHFIYSFRIESDVVMNSVFFKFPFMPDKAKTLNGYPIKVKSSLSY